MRIIRNVGTVPVSVRSIGVDSVELVRWMSFCFPLKTENHQRECQYQQRNRAAERKSFAVLHLPCSFRASSPQNSASLAIGNDPRTRQMPPPTALFFSVTSMPSLAFIQRAIHSTSFFLRPRRLHIRRLSILVTRFRLVRFAVHLLATIATAWP